MTPSDADTPPRREPPAPLTAEEEAELRRAFDAAREEGQRFRDIKARDADSLLDAGYVPPVGATDSSTMRAYDRRYLLGVIAAIGADATLDAARSSAVASQPELDVAWRAAEEALLEGGRIASLVWPTDDDDEWEATALVPDGTAISGRGPTPAAALRALAAALRESSDD